MSLQISNYKAEIDSIKENYKFLQKELDKLKKECIIYTDESSMYEDARDIVNGVLSITQGGIKTYVEKMVSLALESVFGEEYKFFIDFQLKRGQSEASIRIIKDDIELDPKSEVGGGVIDVIALALRLTLWSIRNPKSSPIFILDEPGKHISSVGGLRQRYGDIIRKFSELFNCQFIIVSHDEELINCADKVIYTEIENGVSQIVEGVA